MILLDTDHSTILKYRDSERCHKFFSRLALVVDEVIAVSIVTVEEQMRGWLATIPKERKIERQVQPYFELAGLFRYFLEFDIAHFTHKASEIYDTFGRIHIGNYDRKIAAIAIPHNALLLTANKRHFEKIPGLRFENWMDGLICKNRIVVEGCVDREAAEREDCE